MQIELSLFFFYLSLTSNLWKKKSHGAAHWSRPRHLYNIIVTPDPSPDPNPEQNNKNDT